MSAAALLGKLASVTSTITVGFPGGPSHGYASASAAVVYGGSAAGSIAGATAIKGANIEGIYYDGTNFAFILNGLVTVTFISSAVFFLASGAAIFTKPASSSQSGGLTRFIIPAASGWTGADDGNTRVMMLQY